MRHFRLLQRSYVGERALRLIIKKELVLLIALLGLLACSLCYGEYIVEGEMHGDYNDDGTLCSEWGYIDEAEDIILLRQYFPDGKVMAESVYKDHSLLEGKYYDHEGRVIMERKPIE